jgi:hypothetical protein
MAAINIVTRADDVGSFSGALPASLDAHQRGVIRNASLMVPARWFSQAALVLRDIPSLCLGVHLTICCEWRYQRWTPLSPAQRVPSLIDPQGFFHASPLTLHEAGIEPEQILLECQAQLDRARAYRLPIAYADTHMRWEWMHGPNGQPRMQDLLKDWCTRNSIRWFRNPQLPELTMTPNGNTLLRQIQSCTPGTYLLVHHLSLPGSAIRFESEALDSGLVNVDAQRVAEYELASNPRFLHELNRRDIGLLRFDQL